MTDLPHAHTACGTPLRGQAAGRRLVHVAGDAERPLSHAWRAEHFRLLRQLIAAGNEDDVLDLISSL